MLSKKKLEEIATLLGFDIESEQWENTGWIRLRHGKAPQDRVWARIM